MKHLLTISLLAAFLCVFNYSNAQDVKTKNKANKTKVKEVSSNTATDNTNRAAPNNMSAANISSGLTNTYWKTYIAEPINDTIIIHYAIDSSSVHSKATGETMITSIYKVTQDTLAFYDVGGTHACPSNMTGKYRITISGDTLKMDLIEDECEGRAAAIKNIVWQRVKENMPQ